MSKGSEQGKLFVGGLSWDTTKETLDDHFGRYGEVIDCIVMKNAMTGKSRGFGFVTYKDPACVETVLSSGPHQLDGRQVDPKACNPKSAQQTSDRRAGGGMGGGGGGGGGMERGGGGGGRGGGNFRRGGGDRYGDKRSKIFVGGLPGDADDESLKLAFARYGKVTDVVIMYDQEKKRSRGFGFLTFENEESVDAVCKDHYVEVGTKQVECKRAAPREEKSGGGGGGGGGSWGGPPNSQWNQNSGPPGGGHFQGGQGGYQEYNQGGFNQFQGGYQQQGWGQQGNMGSQGGWMQNSMPQGSAQMGGYGNQAPQGNYGSPQGGQQWGGQQQQQPQQPPQGANTGNYGYGAQQAQGGYGSAQQPAVAQQPQQAQPGFGDYGYGSTPQAQAPADPSAAQNAGYNYGAQYGNMGSYNQQDPSSYGPTRGYTQPQANGAAQTYNQGAYAGQQQQPAGYGTDATSGYNNMGATQAAAYGQGDAGGAGGYGSPPQNRMPQAAGNAAGGYHPYRRT